MNGSDGPPRGPLGDAALLADLGVSEKELLALDGDALAPSRTRGIAEVLGAVRERAWRRRARLGPAPGRVPDTGTCRPPIRLSPRPAPDPLRDPWTAPMRQALGEAARAPRDR